jgi:hypothetical protein
VLDFLCLDCGCCCGCCCRGLLLEGTLDFRELKLTPLSPNPVFLPFDSDCGFSLLLPLLTPVFFTLLQLDLSTLLLSVLPSTSLSRDLLRSRLLLALLFRLLRLRLPPPLRRLDTVRRLPVDLDRDLVCVRLFLPCCCDDDLCCCDGGACKAGELPNSLERLMPNLPGTDLPLLNEAT